MTARFFQIHYDLVQDAINNWGEGGGLRKKNKKALHRSAGHTKAFCHSGLLL